ncbi:MAG: helix-turn-helix transcriptional regulator [Oscillospiraceae bacterium]|nr:helix-turn-helix transcriptional regulator [Oscillospiraceae bacterium]
MTFQERLKQLRKEHGMTQAQLAEKLGVAGGTVAMWETGKRSPNFEMVDSICALFDRRIDYVMGSSDDKTPYRMTEEQQITDGLFQVEDDLTEHALKYARLDEYGRRAVEAIIRVEYERCRTAGELYPAEACSGVIRISRRDVEE